MKPMNYVSIEFPSKSANESFARSTVACFVAQLDPTLDELGDIKTAVSEAVTNCIVHAYPDTIGVIRLKAMLYEDNSVEIVIRDKGCGIENVEEARKPMFTTGNEERTGMGFTIMESFMNDLKVKSQLGKGTTVTMKRKISRRAGGRER